MNKTNSRFFIKVIFMKKTQLTSEQIENFPSLGALIITKQVIDERMPPRFILKDKPNNENDSGWVIFSGMESEEDNENPDNFGVYDAKTLLKLHPDPQLAEVLLKGWIGSVFEYDDEEEMWSEVGDYPLENDYISTHRMNENWILDINNLFIRRVEESGSLMYTTGDKTLRIDVWIDEKSTPEETIARYQKDIKERDQSIAQTIKEFDLSDEKVSRIGYQIEEKNEDREYGLLCAFSFYEKEVIQSIFYFDHAKDIDWALETWRGIRLLEDR